jgi:hypothetical protein
MPEDDGVVADGISRRSALKKGAVVAGAAVWAVPVVQSIGLSPAGAVSGPCNCLVKIIDQSTGFCLAKNCQLTPASCSCLQNDCNCDPSTSGCTCDYFSIQPGTCQPC